MARQSRALACVSRKMKGRHFRTKRSRKKAQKAAGRSCRRR